MYEFDKLNERRGTDSAKWDLSFFAQPEADSETIPMWVADMDFSCPPEVIAAMHDRLDRSPILGYSSYISPSYFKAVCGWYQRRFGWYIHSDSVVVTKGVVPAIKSVILALTQPGDGVIIQKPVYYPFFNTIIATGRTVVNNGLLSTEAGYVINFPQLEQQLADPRNKMLLFCNPHNPTGRVWTKAELTRVGELCEKYDVILLSDEIHGDLTRVGVSYTPVAALFPESQTIITCTAPSKTFNLAGMGLSNIVIRNPLYRKALAEVDGVPQLANPLSIVATRAAYETGDRWVDELRAYLDGNMAAMAAFLAQNLPRAKFQVPEGLYLAWVDLSDYGREGYQLEAELVKHAKLLLECGERFSDGGAGFIRINCACPRSLLMEGLARLAGYLNGSPCIQPLPRQEHPEQYLPATPPITDESCNRCGKCIAACPACAINPIDPYITDPQRCMRCLACVKACPIGARK